MKYPSVTQIIGWLSNFSMVPGEVLEKASERGTQVHQLCAAYAQDLWIPDVPMHLSGYFESFCQWFDLMVAEVVAVEPELKCSSFRFKGHPDLICRIHHDTGFTLVDLKSPRAKQKTWRLQLSAYRHLALQKWQIIRIGSLRLSPEGKPALFDEYTGSMDADFNVFRSAQNVFNFMKKE